MTYAELLEDLKAYIAGDAAWQRANPHQLFFVNEMFQHFLEGPAAMSSEDRIAFIKAMCGAGESTRYGHRPQEVAAQEFANLLAQHAKRQFEDGRRNLAEVRKALKGFAQQTLIGQVNGALQNGPITSVDAPVLWTVGVVRDTRTRGRGARRFP